LQAAGCALSWCRGVTKGGQGVNNSPGAESPWGRQKVPTMSQILSSIRAFAFERPQVRTWGRQPCFLPQAPSNLVTPLSWCYQWLLCYSNHWCYSIKNIMKKISIFLMKKV